MQNWILNFICNSGSKFDMKLAVCRICCVFLLVKRTNLYCFCFQPHITQIGWMVTFRNIILWKHVVLCRIAIFPAVKLILFKSWIIKPSYITMSRTKSNYVFSTTLRKQFLCILLINISRGWRCRYKRDVLEVSHLLNSSLVSQIKSDSKPS